MSPTLPALSRAYLRTLLIRWQEGAVDEEFVHGEAERLWESDDHPDPPESDPRSIELEIISQLDMMNHQWIAPVDIPAMLRFLETPPGSELQAWREWTTYWDAVDFAERRRQLADNSFYSASARSV